MKNKASLSLIFFFFLGARDEFSCQKQAARWASFQNQLILD
jgi:hypothetical protein